MIYYGSAWDDARVQGAPRGGPGGWVCRVFQVRIAVCRGIQKSVEARRIV